jgi:transcriptional regulator with XRE-family HTH domain
MPNIFREHRLRRGWTLRDLARQCEAKGLSLPSDSNLSLIERGASAPRPALRAVLAELLELDIDYFERQKVVYSERQKAAAS